MGDHLIYEDAVSTELYTTSEFTSKQYLYVNDNNNGSYSSQIVLDTTSLSNSGEPSIDCHCPSKRWASPISIC